MKMSYSTQKQWLDKFHSNMCQKIKFKNAFLPTKTHL